MAVLLRLAGYAWRYRWQLNLAYLSLIFSTLLALAIPRLLGTAIDHALEGGGIGRLLLLAFLVLAISLVRGLLSYGQSYLAEAVSQRVAYDLRNRFFEKLQRLSFSFHDRQRTGDLMSKATADVDNVRWFVSFGLIRSVYIVVLVGGVAGLLLSMDWQLALVGLAAVPLAAYLAIKVSRRLRQMWVKIQADTGRMTTLLQENISGIRVVKAFGAQEYEKEKFRATAREVGEDTYRAYRLHAANSALLPLLFAAVTVLILWFGGQWVMAGRLTPGQLAQFVLYLGLLAFPMRMAGWIVNTFSRAISSGERIFSVLDAPSPIQEKPGAIELGRVRGHIRFEGVSFSYNSRVPALRRVSFEVLPGQRVAILGAPGSGKSTIVHLIPRFYDVTDGRITVDGIDIRDVTLASLRRNVGIVFQDVFLFSATIRENIAYGVNNASFERVVAAAKAAQLHDFIMGLPQGYDTWVGERGVTLSGGQRQRLAIARTLLLDPPILILDDSTSSVDLETELLIQKALSEVMRGRTTFIIAHRLSSVRGADLVLVLRDGQIVERGTHQELLRTGGLYREIYELQLRPQEAPVGDGNS
jgi:ATP-binding cassette subfamily B protein